MSFQGRKLSFSCTCNRKPQRGNRLTFRRESRSDARLLAAGRAGSPSADTDRPAAVPPRTPGWHRPAWPLLPVMSRYGWGELCLPPSPPFLPPSPPPAGADTPRRRPALAAALPPARGGVSAPPGCRARCAERAAGKDMEALTLRRARETAL